MDTKALCKSDVIHLNFSFFLLQIAMGDLQLQCSMKLAVLLRKFKRQNFLTDCLFIIDFLVLVLALPLI